MKKRVLALLLTALLVVTMIPMVSADSDNLRNVVVGQMQDIMDVTWTKQAQNSRKQADFAKYQEGGIRPTIYYSYNTLRMPNSGVMMSAENRGSLEYFKTMLGTGESVIEGIPHIVLVDYNKDFIGMDMHALLVDLISRVSADVPTSFEDALTHKALKPLFTKELNRFSGSSKVAVGFDVADLKAGYAKLKKGDLLLAWDRNADVGYAENTDKDTQVDYPRKHVLVVKEVKGDQVTVMYAAYHQPEYRFTCSKCGFYSTEITYRAPRMHSERKSSGTFKRWFNHKEIYTDSSCNGTFEPMTGTNWRTETVSFDTLAAEGDSHVFYGCDTAYLPYTLSAYEEGSPAVQASATTTVTPATVTGGFTAKVTSNYRIVGFEAVLTDENGTVQRFPSVLPGWDKWTWDYNDPALDLALRETKSGVYKLELYAKTGPANPADRSIANVLVHTMNFSLANAGVMLSLDNSAPQQGDVVTVTLSNPGGGLTDIKTRVTYDPEYFVLDMEASQKASPNVTFVDTVDKSQVKAEGQVAVRYAGPSLAGGATVAKLVFQTKRIGDHPVTSGIITFRMLDLFTSTTAGTKDDALQPDRSAGTGMVTVGYNTLIYRNYAQGQDLLLVFMRNEQVDKKTTLPLLYDGQLMYEVTQAHYDIDKDCYTCIFGWFAPNVDPKLVKLDESDAPTNCPEIAYSNDVNRSGFVDVNDAQAIYNIYSGTLPLAGNEIKWLLADVNRDGKVDAADRDALVAELMK